MQILFVYFDILFLIKNSRRLENYLKMKFALKGIIRPVARWAAHLKSHIILSEVPDTVARSDPRPPIADSIFTSGNILSWRLVMK